MNNPNDTEIFYKNIAKQAIREIRNEERQKQKKAILHNTELLLTKYFDIKESIEDEELAFFIDAEEQIILSSVLRNKANAQLLLEYVEYCIEKLEKKFPKESKIIKLMYLTPEYNSLSWMEKIYTIQDQAIFLFGCDISESTITRWRKNMIDELSLLLFKADGLKIWTF